MCLWYERIVSWIRMCLQANGWMNGQWMEWMWLCCKSSVQHRLKIELFSVAMKHIYIYTMIGACKRDQRERWQRYKRKDRNKECLLEGCIQLQFDWREWIKRTQTSNQERTSQQHYIHFDSGYSKGRDKEPPKPTWGMYMRRSCITAWSQARAKRAWARTTLPPLAMYSGVQVSYVLIRFCFTPGGACETRHVIYAHC